MVYFYSDNPNGFVTGKRFSINKPAPTIMAAGMGGDWLSHWFLVDDGKPDQMKSSDKPPFSIPSMAEVTTIPWNGYRVASTFSGCGGFCLGYRMAGFRVVWANEFLEAARQSYEANAAADCILDPRDIREVQPADILTDAGLNRGDLDLFDGSPPCQAFSMAGKRDKGWGKARTYENGVAQFNETLFAEYIRLLNGLQPKVFIAENVSGLVKGTAKGMFLEILTGLKACGYRVACRLVDAQWLGVPQSRLRTIFVGVRNDLGLDPVHPKPLPYRYSVRDALLWTGDNSGNMVMGAHGWFPGRKVDLANEASPTVLAGGFGASYQLLPPSRQKRNAFNTTQIDPEKPCATVTTASPGNDLAVPIPGSTSRRKFTIAEIKRLCAFPDDFVLIGSYAQQWERLGNSVPPLMMRAIATTVRDEILNKAVKP